MKGMAKVTFEMKVTFEILLLIINKQNKQKHKLSRLYCY